jgi:hypothetical protein
MMEKIEKEPKECPSESLTQIKLDPTHDTAR